jgi:hypothetical protein
VYFQGSDAEFIALVNQGTEPVALAGWMVGDAETPSSQEGIYRLPAAVELASGAVFVAARHAAGFQAAFGRLPDAAWESGADLVPMLERVSDLGSGKLALADGGDEVVLLDPDWHLADTAAYHAAAYALLGLQGTLAPPSGFSLQRVPMAGWPVTLELRQRFLAAPPQPFVALGLPSPLELPPIWLNASYRAIWGSLGAVSNFSPGFTAPPQFLLAQAAAQGLDFLAIADSAPAAVPAAAAAIHVPAWRWTEGEEEIIVYSAEMPTDCTREGVAAYLAQSNAPWQAVAGSHLTAAPVMAAPAAVPPASLAGWFDGWQRNGVPALPAGDCNPSLPGLVELVPRYTGLAVASADEEGVREALQARRGWVTSAPGIWLALWAEDEKGQRTWMGQELEPANQVTLHIVYGDRQGEPAGLTLWQAGQPLLRLDSPPTDGQWQTTIPALPGVLLTAVATQFDGDFAVTAPLQIRPAASAAPLLNEVLPAPRSDLNGDGTADHDDEYIELYNPGPLPLLLSGWSLLDSDDPAAAQRMTFGTTQTLASHEHLLLWRTTHRLFLPNESGVVRLLDPAGVERDRIAWEPTLVRGRSVARIPDGGSWVWGANPTPGEANAHHSDPGEPTPAPSQPPAEEAGRPDATAGQAGGPPGSIAQAKLAGLNAEVEFRAVVVAPPGLFADNIYVADVAADGVTAGIGINVYLRQGDYPPLAAGDRVLLRGRLDSFRGETELVLTNPEQIWRIEGGPALLPLAVQPGDIGEALEGRLVTLRGAVTGWQRDSLYLNSTANSAEPSVRVTVRSTLPWKRPYVNRGELWQVTGIVSQFAGAPPWNGGYRVLVCWPQDLFKP